MNTSSERRYVTKKRSEPHLSLFESVLAVSDYIKGNSATGYTIREIKIFL